MTANGFRVTFRNAVNTKMSKGQAGPGRKREVGGYMLGLPKIPEMLRCEETRDKGTEADNRVCLRYQR